MKTKHTPTPWHLDNEGRTVVGNDGIQICTPHGLRNPQPMVNASFIVRAVNSHRELLDALEAMRDAMTSGPERALRDDEINALMKSRNAIAKAEGRS